MNENYEIEGLIPDSEFGIRWKNGAIDRRMRGDGDRVNIEMPKPEPTHVPSDDIFRFIENFLMRESSLAELLVENSIIIESIRDGDVAYYNAVLKSVMDIECRDIKKEEFQYFMSRMRLLFIRHGKTMFNAMTTPKMYAKFSGEKENSVRKKMERGKYDIYPIAGVRFIVIREDEIMEWNRFLMEELMQRDIDTVDLLHRNKIVDLYRKMYGKNEITPVDTVIKWIKSEEIYPSREGVSIKYKYQVSDAYKKYCKFTGSNDIPVRTFSVRIGNLGFIKFSGRTRGFYYWRKV